MKGEQLDEKLDEVHKTLAELDRILADVDSEMTGGRVVTAGDIRVLTNIHATGGPFRAASEFAAQPDGETINCIFV